MDKDAILKSILLKPLEEERRFFDGRAGQDIASFVHDIRSGARISPAHIDFFSRLSRRFTSASNSLSSYENTNISFSSGNMSEGSQFIQKTLALAPRERRGKIIHTLDTVYARASANGFLAIFRPYPIKWNLMHLYDRSAERGGTFHQHEDTPFREHNFMALIMLRIIEELHYTGKTSYIPFILPENNGVLLGHTMIPTLEDNYNRIFMAAAKDVASLGIERYEWIPQLEATVRTFLSFNEMSPALHRVRNQILQYYKAPYNQALGLGFDNYMGTENSTYYADDSRRPLYEKIVMGVAGIMDSPLWQQAVRLPLHLRHNGPARD